MKETIPYTLSMKLTLLEWELLPWRNRDKEGRWLMFGWLFFKFTWWRN